LRVSSLNGRGLIGEIEDPSRGRSKARSRKD